MRLSIRMVGLGVIFALAALAGAGPVYVSAAAPPKARGYFPVSVWYSGHVPLYPAYAPVSPVITA